jgi:copper chaperone
MTTTVFEVPGISCGKCKARIESGLGAVAGVDGVEVDVDGRTVSVTGEASQDTVRGALAGLGYEAAG